MRIFSYRNKRALRRALLIALLAVVLIGLLILARISYLGRYAVYSPDGVYFDKTQKLQREDVPAAAPAARSELLDAAKQHHMNTDVRRAVFTALMGAADAVDGYRRIRALRLAKEQDREVVAVLLYCAGRAEHYNVYYQLVAEQLLQASKGARFTAQLAFWDRMRVLDEHGPTAAINWGRLLGALVAKDFLTLQVLKGLDLSGASRLATAFARVCLQTLLLADPETAPRHAFKRLAALRDADSLRLRKEVHLFLLKRLGKCVDPERRKLLAARRAAALRVLEAAVDELL